jgi:hypothetical protein
MEEKEKQLINAVANHMMEFGQPLNDGNVLEYFGKSGFYNINPQLTG